MGKLMAKPIAGLILIVSLLSIATRASKLPAGNAWFHNNRQGNENAAIIRFYYHDVIDGPTPGAYEVARASITATSPTQFGQVRVLDMLLTVKPDINSEQVGRAQGMIASADLENPALAMNINFVFTLGKFNGSTISIQGRNPYTELVRELSVVGGTELFRSARGYAVISTYSGDVESDYPVYEWTLYFTYLDSSTMEEA